nr:hypothetical protein [Bacillaceae bacterium]
MERSFPSLLPRGKGGSCRRGRPPLPCQRGIGRKRRTLSGKRRGIFRPNGIPETFLPYFSCA